MAAVDTFPVSLLYGFKQKAKVLIGWELESRDQRNDGLILFINNRKTYRLDDTLGYGTEVYEVPEGDMKDYFRAIDKYRPDSYYYSDADIEKIEQVIN